MKVAKNGQDTWLVDAFLVLLHKHGEIRITRKEFEEAQKAGVGASMEIENTPERDLVFRSESVRTGNA